MGIVLYVIIFVLMIGIPIWVIWKILDNQKKLREELEKINKHNKP